MVGISSSLKGVERMLGIKSNAFTYEGRFLLAFCLLDSARRYYYSALANYYLVHNLGLQKTLMIALDAAFQQARLLISSESTILVLLSFLVIHQTSRFKM